MRTLAVSMSMTLDGVMQAPGGPEEDPSGGFTYGGWSVPYWDDALGQAVGQEFSVPFDLLLGRRTYEIFASYWPHAGDEPPAPAMNRATKYVASRTLREVTWAHSHLLTGDVPAAVARLKAQDGPEIRVYGSSTLLQTLLAHDLIDELRVWIFPLVLGTGKRLFAEGTMPGALSLVATTTSTSGVLLTTYRRAGAVQTGSFALEQPTEAELERRRGLAQEG